MHVNRWCFLNWGKPALHSQTHGCTYLLCCGRKQGRENKKIYVHTAGNVQGPCVSRDQ